LRMKATIFTMIPNQTMMQKIRIKTTKGAKTRTRKAMSPKYTYTVNARPKTPYSTIECQSAGMRIVMYVEI